MPRKKRETSHAPPPPAWSVPPPLAQRHWRHFWLSMRAAIRWRTRGLAAVWDYHARNLTALESLLTILIRPEAASPKRPPSGRSGNPMRVPSALPGEDWDRFFYAVRIFVFRHTPGLVGLWDTHAEELTRALLLREGGGPRAVQRELNSLRAILLRPGTAKQALPRRAAETHEHVETVLTHYRALRLSGRLLPYQPLHEPWVLDRGESFPTRPMATDSTEFLALALRQALGALEFSQAELEAIEADWMDPRQAALAVLAMIRCKASRVSSTSEVLPTDHLDRTISRYRKNP